MSIGCELILEHGATPEELTTLGAALWPWCIARAGHAGIYQYLDNQGLADLLAGEFPVSSHIKRRSIQFRIEGEASRDRQAIIDSLRRELPPKSVQEFLLDGISWNPSDPA